MSDGAPISQEIKLPTDSTELGKAVQKLDQLIAGMHKSGKAAEGHAESHKRHAHEIRNEFGSLGHDINYAKIELKELAEAFGVYEIVEGLKKVAEKIIDIGEEAIKSAAAAERMNRVIDNASGGKVQGKQNRDWLDEFSKKTEFSEAQGEGAFVDLKRVGVSDQQSKLAIKAAADIAAGARDKEGAFAEAVGAFQRLQVTGRIRANSLGSLGLGIQDYKTLDRFKGQSDKSIRKSMMEGSVDKNELYQLIMASAHEKAIGEKAAANADLLGTKLSKLSELPERFYKKLADTKAVGELSRALDGALTKLDPDSAAGKKIFGGLEAAMTAIADGVSGIDFDSLATGLGELASDVGPAIEMFKELGHDLGVVFDKLGKVNDAIHDFTPLGFIEDKLAARTEKQSGLVAPTVTDRMKGFDPEAAKKKLHEMGGAKAAMEGPVYEPPEVNSLAAASLAAGKSIPAGVAAGIKSGTPAVAKASAKLGSDSHSAFMSPAGIDAHSPSRKFHYGGQMMGEGVALGYESKADRIMEAMTSTGGPRVTTGGTSSTAGGRGAVHLSLSDGAIQIHVTGHGDKSEIAGMVQQELSRSLVPMLVDALESAQDGQS